MAALTDALVESGKLTPQELASAEQHAAGNGGNVTKSLLALGLATETDLVEALAERMNMAFASLLPGTVDEFAAGLVSREQATVARAMPYGFDEVGTGLMVAVADPSQTDAVTVIGDITGLPVTLALAPKRSLDAAIAQLPEGKEDTSPVMKDRDAPTLAETSMAPSDDRPSADDVRIDVMPQVDSELDASIDLDELLLTLVSRGGSDLHLTAGIPPTIRVDGDLMHLDEFPRMVPDELRKMLYAIMTQKQREQFENTLELDMSYQIPGQARFRVNVFQQRDAIGSVMRVIPFEILPLAKLGMPEQLANFAYLPRGFVLVTGPTGSGKSTTLASMIDLINENRPSHIMTVEDPIEFLHRHKKSVVNQREVGTDTFGFTQALKHVLRQDPDVILVGEMRDLETIQIALTAAETGHLVFGTLHTQDAPQTIDRVIDVFPPHQQEQIRVMLAGALQGVVCQSLLKRADGKGRVAAVEIMKATSAVRNLIREGKTHQIYSSIQAGAKDGMITMDQSLANLFKKGLVTYEAALEKANHPKEFNRLAGRG